MTTRRLERLEAVAAAARTGNKRLIGLALSDLDQAPLPAVNIQIAGAGFTREHVEDLISQIKAMNADGYRLQ